MIPTIWFSRLPCVVQDFIKGVWYCVRRTYSVGVRVATAIFFGECVSRYAFGTVFILMMTVIPTMRMMRGMEIGEVNLCGCQISAKYVKVKSGDSDEK